MGKNVSRYFTGICNGILFATLVAQGVFAFIWGWANLTDYKNLEETAKLYESVHSPGWMLPVLYILQIAACGGLFYLASAALLRGFTRKRIPSKYPFVAMLFLLTNPFVWMTMFTLLPDSVGNAMELLVIAYAFLFIRTLGNEKDWVHAAVAGIWYVVLGIFFKKNFITVTPVLFGLGLLAMVRFSRLSKKRKEEAVLSAIPAFAMILLPFAVFLVAMIKTLATPNPENTLGIPGMLYSVFRFRLDGMKYEEFHGMAWLLKSMCKEWVAALLSPWILALRTYPWGDSVNPFYVSIFWQKAPLITEMYLRIGSTGALLCISAFLLKGLAVVFGKEEKSLGRIFRMIVMNLIFFIVMTVPSTFTALLICIPEFDYRNALQAYLLWFVCSMAFLVEFKEKKTKAEDA